MIKYSNQKGSVYVVLLLLVVVGMGVYIVNEKTDIFSSIFSSVIPSEQTESVPSTSSNNPRPAAEPSAEPSLPPGQFRIYPKSLGSTFVVNNIQFKILSAKNLGTSLSSLGSSQTTTGSYVEVKLSAINTGTTNTSLDNILFAYQDSAHRQYTTSPSEFIFVNVASYKLIGSSNTSYGFDPIKPGFSENYIFITDVAKDSTGISLIVANQKEQNYFTPLGF